MQDFSQILQHSQISQGLKQLVILSHIKMKPLFLLFLFCHVSSPVKHSLKTLYTVSSGIPNLPQLVITVLVDDVPAGSCNSNKTIEITQDVWKTLFQVNPGLLGLCTEQCFDVLPKRFKSKLDTIMQHLNHNGGVHVLQFMEGIQSDEQTGQTLFVQCGYDGQDFMSLDLKTQTWLPVRPEADVIKQEWDADKSETPKYVHFLTQTYPMWLGMCLYHGRTFLVKTVRPSVSLLQTSPSSPVSCHATGFYPDRATMFWSKDGEELHEDVDHGEILPNQDRTFQMTVDLDISSMTVDLDISSVKPEDWTRYDCVFQLSGVKDDIITKLDKAVIRNNGEFPVGSVVGVIAGLILLAVCIAGFFIWRAKKNTGEESSDADSQKDQSYNNSNNKTNRKL
ncbi:hypothetical protein Q5P01_018703 [Channa striata]|uniref:Ig-like domain-containing protein n=1 Tax=Channa striata TaxID=64152 RepID=A0AA88M8A5_CHASR|nr:hypothetical protein Q5P01_018703 [Channa striata]